MCVRSSAERGSACPSHPTPCSLINSTGVDMSLCEDLRLISGHKKDKKQHELNAGFSHHLVPLLAHAPSKARQATGASVCTPITSTPLTGPSAVPLLCMHTAPSACTQSTSILVTEIPGEKSWESRHRAKPVQLRCRTLWFPCFIWLYPEPLNTRPCWCYVSSPDSIPPDTLGSFSLLVGNFPMSWFLIGKCRYTEIKALGGNAAVSGDLPWESFLQTQAGAFCVSQPFPATWLSSVPLGWGHPHPLSSP